MDNTDKTILAFIMGAFTGALTGLLLAPTSGDRTRRKLNQTANNVLYDMEDAWEVNADKALDLADTAAHELEKYGKKLNISKG